MSQISRRSFLKGSIGVAGGFAASSAMTRSARAAMVNQKIKPIATLIDISKCIGCEECVYACQDANESKYPDPQKPFPKMVPSRVPVEDWSDQQDVDDRLTPYNWLFIQHATVTKNQEELTLTIPRRCMHCANPPCVKLCPWGAAKQESNGLSRIDSDLCLGGSKCNKACPWDIPQRQTGVGLYLDLLPAFAGNGVMYKCDRCYNRLEKGQNPACIDACPEDVQTMGPRNDILEKAHALAKEIDGYIYGEHENGGTHTIYVSPVPFDQLNQSVETGKGKPHFNPVKNLMEAGSNLTRAMLLAPIAGVAAAMGRFYMTAKKGDRS